jgi:hypothetical protein
MSSKVRTRASGIGLFLITFTASWLAVRSLAASPEPELDDPPLSLTTAAETAPSEVQDPTLSRLIARFATAARRSR